jgi:hypothetical protein
MDQPELPTGHRPQSKAQLEIADFRGALPEGVMPTRQLGALECNGHLLMFRYYKHKEIIPSGHRRVFKRLVQLGNHPDAPGSVTVLCIWGVQATPTSRKMVLFDHMHKDGSDEMPASNDSIRAAISKWYSLYSRRG